MIELDEEALICDLAETYHIFDYRSLPLKLVATLSVGLRDNSRIKMLASGVNVTQDTLLLAAIADRVEMFRYGFTDAAKNGRKPPTLIVDALVGGTDKKSSKVTKFRTPEEFEAELARLRGKS